MKTQQRAKLMNLNTAQMQRVRNTHCFLSLLNLFCFYSQFYSLSFCVDDEIVNKYFMLVFIFSPMLISFFLPEPLVRSQTAVGYTDLHLKLQRKARSSTKKNKKTIQMNENKCSTIQCMG